MKQALFTLDDVLTFGKYRGKTVAEVIGLNPGYILWLHDEAGFVVDGDIVDAAYSADANDGPPEDAIWQPA